jgi:PAS domain S-box-containing protein
VAAACAGGAYLYSVHHFQSLLETGRQTALAEGELIRAALEHQMIERDSELIDRMIRGFAKQSGVENVMLLDRRGVVRFASSREAAGTTFEIGSPTCQACHRLAPAERDSSRVIETRGGTLLRTVVPFRNEEACHQCHDRRQRINGVLIFDLDAGAMRAGIHQDLSWMVGGAGGLAAVLIGAIALVVRVVVLRRLQRFENTARLIAAGDLQRRVPAEGSDTISWLAQEFNTMADSVTGLLDQVRNQRERLETVINSVDDGIVVLDPQRNLLAANDAFLRRTGRVRDEVLGACCQDLRNGMCSAGACVTAACLCSGQRQVRICERHTEDGKVIWEEVHASPVRNGAGELTQVVEVWRDISDRRAAEAQLAESHRLASLGLLASGFSHELNTPLATVLTCVEGMLRDINSPRNGEPDIRRMAETATIAREQILRCRGITQHFLRMARGQSTPGEAVSLQSTIAAVGRLIAPTARAHGVAIALDPVLPDLHVRADEAELQHTLINLILNGIQACPAGGKVTIAADSLDKTAVRIRVTDTGCGIAVDDQKRVFEPFFGLRKGGTGLGLFLSLNFARRWGGDIRVTSAPGEGSTFEVVFPSPFGASAPERATAGAAS